MKKEFVCIVCPSSCRLTVEDTQGEPVVSGYGCKRGLQHGIQEFTAPRRMLTTTVAIQQGALPRLPVVSSAELPKAKLEECLQVLYRLQVQAPVTCGQVVVQNICSTGVDICASRTLEQA